MPAQLVVLGESDPALRRLMVSVLRGAECGVVECSNSLQVCVELALTATAGAERLLLVLNGVMVQDCAKDIAQVARQRRHRGLRALSVLIVCEMGQLGQPLADVSPAVVVRTLEKPFDIGDLEDVARAEPMPRDATSELSGA